MTLILNNNDIETKKSISMKKHKRLKMKKFKKIITID